MGEIPILALDTADNFCVIALACAGKIFRYRHDYSINQRSQIQSAVIMPGIRDIISEAKINMKAPMHFAVAIGPGSFTGLRIRLATIQGMAIGRGTVIFAPTTLQVWGWRAQHLNKDYTWCIALSTPNGDFFTQRFRAGAAINSCELISYEQLIRLINQNKDLHFITDFCDLYNEERVTCISDDLATFLIKVAQENPQRITSEQLQPFYFHNPEFATYPYR